MEATKYKIVVTVEVLDPESAPALLAEAADMMTRETDHGTIHKTDGDLVHWYREAQRVTF